MDDQPRDETTGARPTGGGPTGGGPTGGGPTDGDTEVPGGPSGTGWRSATVGGQWPATVADTIEGVVSAFRLQVIRPLMLVARGLVFGIIIGTMVLALSVLLSVALVRVLTVYAFNGRVWASYLLLGVLFCAGGIVAWTRRHSAAEDSAEAA